MTDRDLVLLHHLEECRLHLRRRAVDLVGEEEVAEDGAELGVERAGVGPVHTRADEVGRHEVRRELDTLEAAAEDLGGRLDRQRLRQAGHAFDQEVATRQQADEHALEHRVLPGDHALDLEEGLLEELPLLLNGHRLAHGTLLARGFRQVKQSGGKARIKGQRTGEYHGSTMRVLVVEDEQDLAEAIATGLRREGYAVDLAHAGDEALVKARVYPYDLICLDLSLPGTGGREVCRTLRAEVRADGAPQPRILMLTARGGVDDRIAGLDDGADDYLVKPFELGELAARARALLRRNGDGGRAPVRVGSLELDAARHEATQNGNPLALTPKEFALLRYLMSRPGEALSEFELLTHVWDENANPLTRTVRVTVMTLRRKLDGNPIETVPGAGYRLRDDA